MTYTKTKIDRKQLRRERLAKQNYYEEDTNIVVEDTNTNEEVVKEVVEEVVEKKQKENIKKNKLKRIRILCII